MTQTGEGVAASGAPEEEKNEKKEPCKRIYLHAFEGDRTPAFLKEWQRKMKEAEDGKGAGPTGEECLLYAGHVGISFEADSPIYGFNPDSGTEPSHHVIDKLKGHDTYPGSVTNDTAVFQSARGRGLTVLKLEYVYPESKYNEIKARFDAERAKTGYRYGFPGAGDCNCATFPEKIGIDVPEKTGRMKQYMAKLSGVVSPRKMGECEG